MNLRKDLTPKQELSLIKKDNKKLEELISVYPEEALSRLVKNKDKLAKIATLFNNTMVGTISRDVLCMKCQPNACPYKSVCVLISDDLAPVGYACPIEKKIVMELASAIIEDLNIDTQSTMEMELLYDLIDAKLLDMRASGLLADGSVIQIITVDTGRSVTTSKDISPEFKIKMDLKKLKSSIMEDFMATRKAKRRYGLGTAERTYESVIRDAMRIGDDKTKSTT